MQAAAAGSAGFYTTQDVDYRPGLTRALGPIEASTLSNTGHGSLAGRGVWTGISFESNGGVRYG